MSDRTTWTATEARALVGKRVRTTIEFSGVPTGTEATVTRADPGSDGWSVGLTWDLSHEPPAVWFGEVEGEPVTAIRTGKPLTDWFTRDEYERWIVEL